MFDFLLILRRNVISPIVIAIFSLAITLLILGEERDAMFISFVITVNVLLAIVQEVRAQRALKKLELMSAPRARKKFANGNFKDVNYEELISGDVIELSVGDEVPADGTIMSSKDLELDESMLTGESAPVDKNNGAIGYATTSVVAGSALMRVDAVGSNSKAGSMTASLRRYDPKLTPLQRIIQRAITYMTYGALGVAILIFVVYWLSGEDSVRIFKTITSAAVTMVPEGLLLASSLLLAFGSLRLARVNVLPQKISAVEAMALLDVLAVDKTGTLTSPEVTFSSIEFHGTVHDKNKITDLVAITAKETSGGNATGDAIIQSLKITKEYKVDDILAFSSVRKLSGVRIQYDDSQYVVILGAPEYVEKLASMDPSTRQKIELLTAKGQRVLAIALIDDTMADLKHLKDNSGTFVGYVVLNNELRRGVKSTVEYLQDNGVTIKVISGDNPKTVSFIAKRAGISGYDKIITGAELEDLTMKAWSDVIASTTIFARVLPEQKERIIELLQNQGKFTGMVGDGVNDALALKKSNLGIAMFAGASVTRRVADIVLLDNSFTTLPLGMKLGNRIMQAIEIIATLFFHRIIYSLVLLFSTLLLGIVYPFEPRHITFMNMFLITMPTIMWTLFPPLPRHRIDPRFFWKDTLQAVSWIAVISGLIVTISYGVLRSLHPGDLDGAATTTVIIATFFGVYLVFLVPLMLGVAYTRTTRLAQILYILCVIFVVIVSFGFGVTRDFFDFTTPAWRNVWPLLLLIIVGTYVQYYLADSAGRKLQRRTSSKLVVDQKK